MSKTCRLCSTLVSGARVYCDEHKRGRRVQSSQPPETPTYHVKQFSASYKLSMSIHVGSREMWHSFEAGIAIECTPQADVKSVKERAWNTVITEVEKQIDDVKKHFGAL